jgi:nicotinamidase-related amidase
MPTRKSDLHGNAPDSCPVAVLLVDAINDFQFPEAPDLLETALPAARAIAKLLKKARALKIPIVYANDNFGRWRSNLRAVVSHCIEDDVPGRPVARLLKPHRDDYLVLKPKHSAFFATVLELLLHHLGVERVVLAGFAGNICVLFTANDLYMREYELFVPSDCCASNSGEENQAALQQMRKILKADIRPSAELDLRALKGASPQRRIKSLNTRGRRSR